MCGRVVQKTPLSEIRVLFAAVNPVPNAAPGTGDTVQTFTIITTVPNELCGAIHNRMPVILPREKWATWLGEHEAAPDELRWMILRPYPAGLMRAYPVDVRLGNVRNNDAALLEEINIAA